MFKTEFEKLSSSDQEYFRKSISSLLCHTFILSNVFDSASGESRFNPEYGFVLRYYELIEDYLSYSGYSISRDTDFGVIWVSSFPNASRVRLDKFTTLMCYTLRLIYTEEREKISLHDGVSTSIEDLITKMSNLNLFQSRPNKSQIKDSLRQLIRFRLITKGIGSLDEKTTRILILPSIVFVLSEAKLDSLARLASANEENIQEASDEDAETTSLD